MLHTEDSVREAAIVGELAQELVMAMTPTTSSTIVPPSARGESAYRGPCRVLGAHITRVTRGGTVQIICGEYCEAEESCRLKKAALESGTTQGVTEASSGGVAPGGTRCVMLRA